MKLCKFAIDVVWIALFFIIAVTSYAVIPEFSGIASGTIIYFIVIDILDRKHKNWTNDLAKKITRNKKYEAYFTTVIVVLPVLSLLPSLFTKSPYLKTIFFVPLAMFQFTMMMNVLYYMIRDVVKDKSGDNPSQKSDLRK